VCEAWKKQQRDVRDITKAFKPEAMSNHTLTSTESILKTGTKKLLLILEVGY
jgi:hypothetical protein